jgi:hypothetical protein
VLQSIRDHLGPNWPIWIVSGNLTRGLKEELMRDFDISLDHIFSKPLNDTNDSLVEAIHQWLVSSLQPDCTRTAVSPPGDQGEKVGERVAR